MFRPRRHAGAVFYFLGYMVVVLAHGSGEHWPVWRWETSCLKPPGTAGERENAGTVRAGDTRGAASQSRRNPHCPIEGACSLQGIMAEGQRAFVDVLERYSIADLIRNKADLLQLVG